MNELQNFPFTVELSFSKVLEMLKKRMEQSQSSITKNYLQSIIDYAASYPELIAGISDCDNMDQYKEATTILLDNLFPAALTRNEIKAAGIPFHNELFNPTKRFASILKNAGPDFELELRNLDRKSLYVMGCVIILNTYYGYDIDYIKPMYYDIPDKNGIWRSYRATMNADFIYIEPTENAVEITKEIANTLIANVDDFEMWEKYFPINSWKMKGIAILSLTDVTIDDSISDLKSTLLADKSFKDGSIKQFSEIFQSIYNIPDLRIGFTEFNSDSDSFNKMEGNLADSFILNEEQKNDCRRSMCEHSYNTLVRDKKYFVIPDTHKYAEQNEHNLLAENLLTQNIQSCILAPIAKGNRLLGVLELASFERNKLHSLNATKLDEVMPFLVSTLERKQAIQKDILIQLDMVDRILDLALESSPMPIYEQVKFRIEEFTLNIKKSLNASAENEVFNLLQHEVNPLLNHLNTQVPELKESIDLYKESINNDTGLIYKNRKNYDDTVQLINQNMATFLDRKQQEAQLIFPHYFERYKTDGVDHNIYIGASMTPSNKFSKVYLYNLRLWQLCTMCEMENNFYHKQEGAELQFVIEWMRRNLMWMVLTMLVTKLSKNVLIKRL